MLGGGNKLLFVKFCEFLKYVYEKYVILKLSVCFMLLKKCVAQQHLKGLERAFPISYFCLGYTLKYYLILFVKYNKIKDIDLLY